MTNIKIILLLFMSACAATAAHADICTDVKRSVVEDMRMCAFNHANKSREIFEKYKKSKTMYSALFSECICRNETRDDFFRSILLFSSTSRIELPNNCVELHLSKSGSESDFYIFYMYSMGNKWYLSILRERYARLLIEPCDSPLIVFLPFLNDVEFVSRYADKLFRKVDGIPAELLFWAYEYTLFRNRDSPKNLDILKNTKYYKMYAHEFAY